MSKSQSMLCPADAIQEAPSCKREGIAEIVAIARGVRSMLPQEALSAVRRRHGVVLDVREGEGLQPLALDHYRIALTDIEKFMAGRLSGEQVQDFVSMLIFLAAKWRAAYVVAGTDEESRAAVLHLARLGFTDSAVVVGGAGGLCLRPSGRNQGCSLTEAAPRRFLEHSLSSPQAGQAFFARQHMEMDS